MLASAATSAPIASTSAIGAAGPEMRVRSRPLGRHGVTGEQRVGGVGQTVEVESTGDDRNGRDRRDRAEHGLTNRSAEDGQRHGSHRADERADDSERRRSGPIRARRRDRQAGEEADRVPHGVHRQPAATGRRTSAGSTPKTVRIVVPSSVSAGGPSATIRPPSRTTTRGKKWAASARSWRTATIVVPSRTFELDEQLHHLDLVADVEVRGRLIHDEDRGGLGEGHGDEDQLPLAHRQLADVARTKVRDPDALDRSVDRRDVAAPKPGEGRVVRQPAERDDLDDRHREREVCDFRHDRDRPRERRSPDVLDRVAGTGRPTHSVGTSTPVSARSRVDLPAPLGPTSATRSPRAMASVAPSTTVRSPYVMVTSDASRIGAAVRHSSYPERVRCSRNRKNGAPSSAITTPTGTSPRSRATRSAADTSAAPTTAEIGRTRFAAGPDQQTDDVGNDEADEPDQTADRDGGRRRHRCESEQDPSFAADVDAQMARGGVPEQQRVERPAPRDDQGGRAEDQRRRRRAAAPTTPRRDPRAGTRRSAAAPRPRRTSPS